jgi:hypothetical protein
VARLDQSDDADRLDRLWIASIDEGYLGFQGFANLSQSRITASTQSTTMTRTAPCSLAARSNTTALSSRPFRCEPPRDADDARGDGENAVAAGEHRRHDHYEPSRRDRAFTFDLIPIRAGLRTAPWLETAGLV